MVEDRSLSDVVHDVLGDLQEIVRSEVRLAKVEIRHEATLAASAGLWVSGGVVGALTAWMCLVWAAVYGLATVMPMWASLLVVCAVMATAGVGLVKAGLRRFRRISPVPERTAAALKENFEWLKPSTK